VEVLVDNLRALDRAKAFAERVNEPEVWSKLAKAQLDEEQVHEAVASYVKAQDPQNYAEVIAVAQREGAFEDLGKYLKMVRKQIKEPQVRRVALRACRWLVGGWPCLGGVFGPCLDLREIMPLLFPPPFL
jgi:clathrin heavy chain